MSTERDAPCETCDDSEEIEVGFSDSTEPGQGPRFVPCPDCAAPDRPPADAVAGRCANPKCRHIAESSCHERGRMYAPMCRAGAHPFTHPPALAAARPPVEGLREAANDRYESDMSAHNDWRIAHIEYLRRQRDELTDRAEAVEAERDAIREALNKMAGMFEQEAKDAEAAAWRDAEYWDGVKFAYEHAAQEARAARSGGEGAQGG